MIKEITRIKWIDSARGFCIILMLLGHTNCPLQLNKVIFAFHVPFFFILSGYLYNDEKWSKLSFKETLRERGKSLLLPYFFFTFVCLILNLPIEIIGGLSIQELTSSTLSHVFWILYSYGDASKMPNCTPLWYLPTLFVSYIYVYFVKEKKYKIYSCFCNN